MLLAADIGNSNIVIGVHKNGKWILTERINTLPKNTSLEYAIHIKAVFDIYNLDAKEITGCIISSVVPPITQTLAASINKLTGAEPIIVGAGVKNGLNIRIDDPAQLGADMVCGAVAAIRDYSVPCVIFDLGTATTVSVIDNAKNFLGGLILPGVGVSLNALAENASLLPHISLDKPKKVIGTNSVDSMRAGILYGTAAQIDGVAERIEDELGYHCQIIATGGFAPRVVQYCSRKVITDDLLLLNGMLYIYEKNKQKK